MDRGVFNGGSVRRFARGRIRPKPGQMNKRERAYEIHLEAERKAGRVLWFLFEGIKLRLAEKTFYTPDFVVMTADGLIEFHEVKGFWEDDARVKIKCAAESFPFRFLAITKEGVEEI